MQTRAIKCYKFHVRLNSLFLILNVWHFAGPLIDNVRRNAFFKQCRPVTLKWHINSRFFQSVSKHNNTIHTMCSSKMSTMWFKNSRKKIKCRKKFTTKNKSIHTQSETFLCSSSSLMNHVFIWMYSAFKCSWNNYEKCENRWITFACVSTICHTFDVQTHNSSWTLCIKIYYLKLPHFNWENGQYRWKFIK